MQEKCLHNCLTWCIICQHISIFPSISPNIMCLMQYVLHGICCVKAGVVITKASFVNCVVKKKYPLGSLNHFHSWQVLPQLDIGDTCQISTWYSIDKRYWQWWGIGRITERANWFSIPDSWTFHIYRPGTNPIPAPVDTAPRHAGLIVARELGISETKLQPFSWRHFQLHFLQNASISIKVSLRFVPKGPINNIPALVQIMGWRLTGAKP